MFPLLKYPDYYNGDLFPPTEGGPGGNAPDQPSDGQGGGLGGGAGGGI